MISRTTTHNMTVQMIDCIQEGREDAEEALRCLEGVWQHRLATFEVHGNINSRDELTMNRHQQNNHPLVRFAQGILVSSTGGPPPLLLLQGQEED